MSRHSLGAYRIVLRMRTARTLLVEGDTDKTVIHRMLLDQPIENQPVAQRPIVDTPAILSDPALRGLGNKAQVELIAEACRSEAGKFLALVDREWEGFDIDSLELNVNDPNFHVADGAKMRTFGHSIENYFFERSSLISLIRRQFAVGVNVGALRLIEDHFHIVCAFALAYSLAAKQSQLISRLVGVLSRTHIRSVDGDFRLDASIANCLVARGVAQADAEGFVTNVSEFQQRIAERQPCLDTLKWASHGHLGSEAIWTCVAKMLELSGASDDVCEQVGRGMQGDKLKHGADVIAMGAYERRPLEWLAKWLVNLEEAPAVELAV